MKEEEVKNCFNFLPDFTFFFSFVGTPSSSIVGGKYLTPFLSLITFLYYIFNMKTYVQRVLSFPVFNIP